MNFVADLHIHSRFSMATSRSLTAPYLAFWARRKGIQVLGSGDFTHPGWRAELNAELVRDEHNGFYRLAKEPESIKNSAHQDSASPVWFCPQTEISCIYKADGKTRKVHNLVFMPDFEAAERFSAKLALIGKLESDGRPILKLDSRDLLEIALESSSDAVFIPAHIWTPWYAVFGSKSGFDQLEDCYRDLTSHIFALETGLSSDPPMNRLLSKLDNYALISNSDAHSGPNLGREANLFAGIPSYAGMFGALKMASQRQENKEAACKFLGTLEFYPEEGKYHLDGHRSCGVSLTPQEAQELNNSCPVCGKPLTLGVLHRVMELADRKAEPQLIAEPEARMLAPLPEVIGQITGAKPGTRKNEQKCLEVIQNLGAELDVLCLLPLEQITAYWEPLGEAVKRIRKKTVAVEAGFDGQYGQIKIFEPGEPGEKK